MTPPAPRPPVPTAARRAPPTAPAPDDAFLRYPGSALVVALLADKWTIPVIHTLARGTHRTGALRAALPGVSQKMLTQTLRALEEHGLVERTVYPEVPPRVEYRLTAMGESLNEPLAAVCAWTERHGAALARASARRRAARARTAGAAGR